MFERPGEICRVLVGPAALCIQPNSLAEDYGCSWHGIKLMTSDGSPSLAGSKRAAGVLGMRQLLEVGGVEANYFMYMQSIHVFGTDLVPPTPRPRLPASPLGK